MLRCRILNEPSSAYVCALCRHPALARQRELGRRNYSNESKPPSNGGAWGKNSVSDGTAASTIPRRPVGPLGGSGWGTPAFGGGLPSVTSTSSAVTSSNSAQTNGNPDNGALDGLLPHERAARQRLAAQRPAAPRPIQPKSPTTSRNAGHGTAKQYSNEFQRGIGFQKILGGSSDNVSPAKGKSLGGLDEKPLRSNHWQGFQDKKATNEGSALGGNDWRHRGLDRNAPSGSDRKLQSIPVPHHRPSARDAAVKEDTSTPLRQDGLQEQNNGLGQSVAGGSHTWGLLARKPQDSHRAEASGSSDALGVGDWGLVFRKTQGSGHTETSDTTMSKESFFAKFQEHMETKSSDDVTAPRSAHSPKAEERVDENVPVTQPEKSERRREFDETYEIDRDSKRRDKAGNRRGLAPDSYRGMKKSFSQQRWEDANEEWSAKGSQRAAERRQQKAEEKARRKALAEAAAPQTILLPEFISISNLAQALKLKTQEFLVALEQMGFEEVTEDSIMTGETAALVAMEYGFEPTVDTGGAKDLKPRPPPEDASSLPQRPPVVTIMGHVDHGKTTLLDYLRKSSIAAQEHGGITQHIGAFMVKMSSGKLITFLDTPGHAAFLSMRQRGANVTDIVVLVVAADDSVKPQTIEAIKHARAAKVPIIVAINKVDKEDARPDQVKTDLARHGVEIEDFGGDVQVVCVSGKTGQGMDELEENIVALAEVQDMRAEVDGLAEAWVLEASIKPYGKSANVLVKRGTLRRGDHVVAGTAWARVRVLRNEAGQELTEAPPGTPVEVLGWRDELPAAGDEILQAPDEDRARIAVEYREEMREREASSKQLAEQEQREREAKAEAEAAEEAAAGEDAEAGSSATKIVNFLVRGDVVGSVEAVCATINEIGNNEVRPRILRSAAGQVSESDVEHAEASNSVIANFNNPVPNHIKRLAEEKGVKILDHSVIYHLADDIKQVMSENLADKIMSKVTGEAEILQIFPINVKGRVYKNIAGCRVRNGSITRSTTLRIIRGGEKVFDGKIETLKHGKKEVAEIRKGSECGISFDGFTDFQVGDQIQTYEEVREKRSL